MSLDAYHLLSYVPKRAIVDRLLSDDVKATDLDVAYRVVRSTKAAPTRQSLVDCSMKQLIEVFKRCKGLSESDARDLHDSWRYRGTKSLFLYRFVGGKLDVGTLVARLNDAVDDALPSDSAEFDSRFEFENIEAFDFKSKAIAEVRYKYAAPMGYVDPEDEEAKTVSDLRNGFLWIAESLKWAAIGARDLETRDLIAGCLTTVTTASISRVQLSNDVVERLEKQASWRRAALVDPKTKTTRRYSGQHLGKDASAIEEIGKRKTSDEIPFTGYSVDVDRHTEMVLGYNNPQGKVFFSKDLTAEQLRRWGPAKIVEIFREVDGLLKESDKYRGRQILAHLGALPKSARAAAASLAAAVAVCRAKGQTSQPIPLSSLELREALGNLVSALPFALDEQAEEVGELACPSCDRPRIAIDSYADELVCRNCHHRQKPGKLALLGGGRVNAKDLSEVVQVLPNEELIGPVLDAVTAVTKMPTDPANDFFFVRGKTLYYQRLAGEAILDPMAIPELVAILNGPVPAARLTEIKSHLPQYKEKCSKMTTKNCAGCVGKRVGKLCYLRLFGLADADFTPQPHGAIEYGDYSRPITINGKPDQYLAVLMKKTPTYDGAITSSNSDGREILEQAFKYLQTGSTAAVGISVPRMLHSNLKSMLVKLAMWHGKKLIFFDEPVLARLVHAAMKSRSMTLADL